MEVDTLPKLLKRNFERWGEREVAFRDKDYGIWNEYTWKDVYENVKYFSLGLVSLGLRPGERAAVIGDNEPQWYWASLAIQAAQGITVALFTDAIPNEVQYIVDHSDSKFIVARDQEQVDKLLAIWDNVPKAEKVIWWYWKGMRKYDQHFIMSYEQVKELGKKYEESHPRAFEENVEATKGDETANIFYTSGTTGVPKGAMITHKALIGSTEATLTLSDITYKDNVLCYLPPAWVGEAFFTTVPHLITGAKMNTLEEPETKEILEKASPYLHSSFEGEAILSIGKSIDLLEKGASGIINAMPFGCMPGTIVTALLRGISRDYGVPCINIPYDGTESPTTEIQLEAFIDQAGEYSKQNTAR